VGRDDRSRPIFLSFDREFFSAPRFPFSIFHFRIFLFRKKSLRDQKTFPIFTRHKRMALLLPVLNRNERRAKPVTGTG
jgi:hypothetical protein